MKKSELKQLIKEELDKILIKKGNTVKIEGIPFRTTEDVKVEGRKENAKIVQRLRTEIKQMVEEELKEQGWGLNWMNIVENTILKLLLKYLSSTLSQSELKRAVRIFVQDMNSRAT